MKFLLLFSLFASVCLGQETSANKNSEKPIRCENGNCLVAIATKGLKIRDTSSTDGMVVGTIPFGEKVEVIESGPPLMETIDRLYGYWVKIKYKGVQGYAFSCFLTSGIIKMDQPYYLLIPNGGCGNNAYYSLTYNYYGFYKHGEIDAMDVAKINPIFYESEFLTTLYADSTAQPAFVIAAKDTMTCNVRKCSSSNANLFSASDYYNTKGKRITGLTNGEYYLEVENFDSPDYNEKKLVMVNQKTKKKQVLAISSYTLQLIWDGDLDNDGKIDLIIFNGGGGSGHFELFLSSKAKQGNFVKKVASFEAGDCC